MYVFLHRTALYPSVVIHQWEFIMLFNLPDMIKQLVSW